MGRQTRDKQVKDYMGVRRSGVIWGWGVRGSVGCAVPREGAVGLIRRSH